MKVKESFNRLAVYIKILSDSIFTFKKDNFSPHAPYTRPEQN